MRQTNQPLRAFRRGACNAAVFANTATVSGKAVQILKAHVQRCFQDKNGNWLHVASFGVNDIPKVVLCLQEAYAYMTSREESSDERDDRNSRTGPDVDVETVSD